jgi:hypothetical protein
MFFSCCLVFRIDPDSTLGIFNGLRRGRLVRVCSVESMGSRMINYELYDSYGKRIGLVTLPVDNYETIIIERQGAYYRPICYQNIGTDNIAKCVPVKMFHA